MPFAVHESCEGHLEQAEKSPPVFSPPCSVSISTSLSVNIEGGSGSEQKRLTSLMAHLNF